jgi:hypothetical protein
MWRGDVRRQRWSPNWFLIADAVDALTSNPRDSWECPQVPLEAEIVAMIAGTNLAAYYGIYPRYIGNRRVSYPAAAATVMAHELHGQIRMFVAHIPLFYF